MGKTQVVKLRYVTGFRKQSFLFVSFKSLFFLFCLNFHYCTIRTYFDLTTFSPFALSNASIVHLFSTFLLRKIIVVKPGKLMN